MVKHGFNLSMTVVLIGVAMFYPYAPGSYDPLAAPLSAMVQLMTAAGLLLVPLGVVWWTYELRKASLRKRGVPYTDKSYAIAATSAIAASVLGLAVALLVFIGLGLACFALLLAFYGVIVARVAPRLRSLKSANLDCVNPAPLYLIVPAVGALLLQVTFAAAATNSSRSRAIENCATLIDAVERHHAEHGDYPDNLASVWKDYYPDIVGIEKYHYKPSDGAYSLYFEQPRFLFHDFGVRELVMYDPADHTSCPATRRGS